MEWLNLNTIDENEEGGTRQIMIRASKVIAICDWQGGTRILIEGAKEPFVVAETYIDVRDKLDG